MHKDVVAAAELGYFAEISLVIFVSVFLMIIARALFMKKDRVEKMESLPLEDGQVEQSFEPVQEST